VDPGVQVEVQGTARLYVLGSIRFDAGSSLSVSTRERPVQAWASSSTVGSPVNLSADLAASSPRPPGYDRRNRAARSGEFRFTRLCDFRRTGLCDTTNTIVLDHSTSAATATSAAAAVARHRTRASQVRRSKYKESYVLIDAATLTAACLPRSAKAGQRLYLKQPVIARILCGLPPFQLSVSTTVCTQQHEQQQPLSCAPFGGELRTAARCRYRQYDNYVTAGSANSRSR